MKKIEVKILNPESIDQAEKMMVCAARLTQRGHQISCLDDFMDLYSFDSMILFLAAYSKRSLR